MLRVLLYILYLIFFLISCYVFSINCHNIYYHYSIISNHSEDQAAFSSKQVSFHPLILTHFIYFCRPHDFPHSSHITSFTSCCRRRRRRHRCQTAAPATTLPPPQHLHQVTTATKLPPPQPLSCCTAFTAITKLPPPPPPPPPRTSRCRTTPAATDATVPATQAATAAPPLS